MSRAEELVVEKEVKFFFERVQPDEGAPASVTMETGQKKRTSQDREGREGGIRKMWVVGGGQQFVRRERR
jgi:hypothetical protein